MNASIIPYVFESSTIRVESCEAGEPLFCANDVCAVLEYGNPHDAVARHVDIEDLVKREVLDSNGKTRGTNFINESGLYSLIIGCKLPAAKRFKRWVTSEVLPSIRKTGSYQLHPGVPMSFAEALQLAADQQRLIESQAAQIGNMTPLAQLGSAVSGREYMTLRDWISELKNERSEVKEKRVHQFLIERGFLYRNPMRRLRAYAQHDHLFALKEICCADGQYRSTLVITGAGMSRLYDAVLNDAVETGIGGLRIV